MNKRNFLFYPQKGHPKYRLNIDFFKKWSNNMAYILGFIAADGCVPRSCRRLNPSGLTIKLSKSDVGHLYKIRKILGSDSPIRTRIEKAPNGKYYPQSLLEIHSVSMAQDIISLGITPNKTPSFKWPHIPEKFTWHFIRGFMDGDGSIWWDKRYKHWSVSFCGTYEGMEGLKKAVKITGGIGENGGIYRIALGSTKKSYEFLVNVYRNSTKNTRLDRKYKLFKKICESMKSIYASNSIERRRRLLAVRAYIDGMGTEDIGKNFNLGSDTLYKILKVNGIHKKGRGSRKIKLNIRVDANSFIDNFLYNKSIGHKQRGGRL